MTSNTKLSPSNINRLSWDSSLPSLYSGYRPPSSIPLLENAGIATLKDLLWLFPLRSTKFPSLAPYNSAILGQLFYGHGVIQSFSARPVFRKQKKRGRFFMSDIVLHVKDKNSPLSIRLQWFNAYPNLKKKLNELAQLKSEIYFLGKIETFQGQLQIINPQLYTSDETPSLDGQWLIEYPTVNTVNGEALKKVLLKIPQKLWDEIPDPLENIIPFVGLPSLSECFKIMHGPLLKLGQTEEGVNKAKQRLIYHEFFLDQIKLQARREKIRLDTSPQLTRTPNELQQYKNLFPYQLTNDQIKSLEEILFDLSQPMPMMRLIQGDVGSGKTSVALIAALVTNANNYQTALMCPTESLAYQHFKTASKVYSHTNYKVKLLLGSMKTKEKNVIYQELKSGEIHLIIGTHTLFQESVVFKSLGLAIIDEQHKFGVEQRIRLSAKGNGAHTLILTATPIPRSLGLAHYGDLDISLIKSMPLGRKGIKTKLVTPALFSKFLSFVKTRLDLKEQIYVVVPAIEENEDIESELQNLKSIYEKFCAFFPHHNIACLHGKMTSEEKAVSYETFSEGKTNILISTTVIEVGIDVPSATVMAIFNPERFGLSSLHQLRGRVGRGNYPGFCFLIVDSKLSPEALTRLKVIEDNLDGFIIAEEDLKIRGEGDLFGKNQSGEISTKRIANIVRDGDILEQVCQDFKRLYSDHNKYLLKLIAEFKNDPKIFFTI